MIRNPSNRRVRGDRIAVGSHSHHVSLDGMGTFVVHHHEIDIDHPEHGHHVSSGTLFQMSATSLEFLRQQAELRKTK